MSSTTGFPEALGDTKKRLFFDCETAPFSDEFKKSESNVARLKLAPPLRVICAFIEPLSQHEFYEPNEKDLSKFAARLSEADEIISFNGDQFDFLVLKKSHPNIFKKVLNEIASEFRHLDLMKKFQNETGAHFRFSLHKMAKLNLGRGKHTSGRSMENLNIEELKVACQSDVDQLYQLWKLWMAGKIKYPPHPTPRNIGWDDDADPMPGSELSLPDVCPACGIEGTLFNLPPDRENMTEGQEIDYMMGFRLDQMCRNCALLISDGEPFAQFPEVLRRLKVEQPLIVFQGKISDVLKEPQFRSRLKPLTRRRPQKQKRPK